jgi:Fe-S oxidoreductase
MARMKIEYLAHYKAKHGHTLRDRAVAYVPRYAPWAAALAPLSNLLTSVAKGALGFTEKRELPRWRSDWFRSVEAPDGDVVLLVDTFNRYFEPENAHAALKVLRAAGYRVHAPEGLCCGRTFLTAGMVEKAKREAANMQQALAPFAERGVPIVGLEPSCLFSLRDEFPVMGFDKLARQALLFEEFLAREPGRLKLKEIEKKVLLHGHCHQKAFDAMPAVQKVLRMIPGVEPALIETSCCGMAGSFGYEAEHYDVSLKMAEMTLLPAIRKAGDALVVADGTSCRHQILDGAGREAVHVARVLELAL